MSFRNQKNSGVDKETFDSKDLPEHIIPTSTWTPIFQLRAGRFEER
jgi:hypothetical protein